MPELIQLVDHLQPVHVRHVEVEEDEIRPQPLEHRRRLARVVRAIEAREAGAFEKSPEQLHVGGLVVDDEDPRLFEARYVHRFGKRRLMGRLNPHSEQLLRPGTPARPRQVRRCTTRVRPHPESTDVSDA